MHLKIFCEKTDVLTMDILKKLHNCGYRMEIIPFEGIKPSEKEFFSFYSRRLLGPFVQLSLCNPKKVRKNFSASKNILFLAPDYVFDDEDLEIIGSVDYVLVANPIVSSNLLRHGLDKRAVIKDVKCYYDNFEVGKANMDNFTFLFHNQWKNEIGWKEMLFSYCHVFPNREADLVISTYGDGDEINQNIDRFLSLNNFNRTCYPGIYVLTGKEFEDVLRFASCFVAPYLVDFYDQNVLTAMQCEIPVIINRLSSYQHFCRKNTAWIVDFINDNTLNTLQMMETMKNIVENQEQAEKKAKIASQFLKNNFGKEDFLESVVGVVEKCGIIPLSDMQIDLNKKGDII